MKAFPTEHPIAGMMDLKSDGMELRDYFAAKAMQADIGNVGKYKGMDYSDIAKRAYEMAEAMMEARND
jgi:hypothetical protein